MDFIKELIQSEFGSWGFISSLMGLAFWLTHWLTKKVTKINTEHSHFTQKIDNIERNFDEVRKDLSYLKGSLDIIKNAEALTQSYSPISLTPKGKEVAKELKADTLIAKNWEKIYKELTENIKDKNAYDIQQYCIETTSEEPEKMFDKESLDLLKTFAYKKGNSLQLYLRMLGVLIRDAYMKKENISITEIDKYDPNI